MSDFHWGDVYYYADRNRSVQTMRKRSALIMHTNPRWTAHMQKMADELAIVKFHNNLTEELLLTVKNLPTFEHARLARERIDFYLNELYHDTVVRSGECAAPDRWSVY